MHTRHWLTSALIGCLVACDDNDASTDAGGTGGMDAGRDASTADARTADATMDSGTTVSWYATKTTLDVWWTLTSHPLWHDPGRGIMDIYTFTDVTRNCDDPVNDTTVRICGVDFPPFTSDMACEAFHLTIPNSTWEQPSMPRFQLSSATTDANDAGGLASVALLALLGVDHLHGSHGDPWQQPEELSSWQCDNGTGLDCFPDHDDDEVTGITARFRSDDSTYVGPYDDGQCTPGIPYRLRQPPIMKYPCGVNCLPPSAYPRAETLHIGLRASLRHGVGVCGQHNDAADNSSIDMRVAGCAIDPATLRDGSGVFEVRDPRLDSMDYTCTTDEASTTNLFMPQYRVLHAGERPGDSMRPNGWIVAGRDIDTRVSEGTKVVTVQLDNDTDGGTTPTCTQVRAALTGM